jgi:TRAP-type C4-dicarboxylate transport system permease small subunit
LCSPMHLKIQNAEISIMQKMLKSISGQLGTWMETVAGTGLVGVMLLTGADIVGRIFGFPVAGTYEIVSLAGGLIIGLALPATSRAGGHVSTDVLLGRIPEKAKLCLTVATRLIGIMVFLLAGYGMIMMGVRLKASGEVTAALALPFYYITYAIGGAFLVQALTLLSEMIETLKQRGRRE